jgi:hypothetical protein
MPTGSQEDRTLARRLKKGVASTVRSAPKGFRERVAGLVLPVDERPPPPPPTDDEVIRRGAEIPFEVWEQHGWHLTRTISTRSSRTPGSCRTSCGGGSPTCPASTCATRPSWPS